MPDDTPALDTVPAPRESFGRYRICLVCLGNICRSPMAEVVLREELARAGLAGTVRVESAGTGDWHLGERMFEPARAELARRGYDAAGHRARQVKRGWLSRYDLVLAMDQANLANLRQMASDAGAADRVRLLRWFDPALTSDDPYRGEVPDPYGGGPEGYELALDLVLAAVQGLTVRLARALGLPAPGRP
jgi:low molecular weight protein-tyrosine phosphatase